MKIIEKFQSIFDCEIMPYILKTKFIINNKKYYEPLIYTLVQKSNKFRSATCLISAKFCKIDKKQILPIAMISELIHNSIIIQDDIADCDEKRRKKMAAWKKYGRCYSLYSSLYVIPDCLKIIDNKKVHDSFLYHLQNVYKQQACQNFLTIKQKIPYKEFMEIHLGKTAIGQWSIISPAIVSENKKIENLMFNFSKKLGDAGTIKNDLENIIRDNLSDIKYGIVTYPIYKYFQKCNEYEKKIFLSVFGKINHDFDYNIIKKDFIKKGISDHCKQKIKISVNKAKKLLKNLPDYPEKNFLLEWADEHIII